MITGIVQLIMSLIAKLKDLLKGETHTFTQTPEGGKVVAVAATTQEQNAGPSIDIKYKVVIVVISLASSFAIGRYTVPEKVRIETKIVEVEKKSDSKEQDSNKNNHKKIVIVRVVKPDGEKQTTVTSTDESTENKKNVEKVSSDTQIAKEDKKEVTGNQQKVTISALVGGDITTRLPVYGLSITRPILGPLTVGLFGLSNGSIGASVGLTF